MNPPTTNKFTSDDEEQFARLKHAYSAMTSALVEFRKRHPSLEDEVDAVFMAATENAMTMEEEAIYTPNTMHQTASTIGSAMPKTYWKAMHNQSAQTQRYNQQVNSYKAGQGYGKSISYDDLIKKTSDYIREDIDNKLINDLNKTVSSDLYSDPVDPYGN